MLITSAFWVLNAPYIFVQHVLLLALFTLCVLLLGLPTTVSNTDTGSSPPANPTLDFRDPQSKNTGVAIAHCKANHLSIITNYLYSLIWVYLVFMFLIKFRRHANL